MAKQNVSGVLLVSLLSFDPLPISFSLPDDPLARLQRASVFLIVRSLLASIVRQLMRQQVVLADEALRTGVTHVRSAVLVAVHVPP